MMHNNIQAKSGSSSVDQMHLIINAMVDGIVIVDEMGILHFMNPAAETLFGRKKESMLNEMFGFPLVDTDKTEIEILNKDRGEIVVELRVVEIEWEKKTAFLATLRDITERKQAEKAARLAESLENLQLLAGAIAHEFSQPLQILGCLFDIMEMEQGKNKRLDKCRANSERIAGLVRQLRNVVVLEKQSYLNDEILDLAASSKDVARKLYNIVTDELNIPSLTKEGASADRNLESESYNILKSFNSHSRRNEKMQKPVGNSHRDNVNTNNQLQSGDFANSKELFAHYLSTNTLTQNDIDLVFEQIEVPLLSLDDSGNISRVNSHAEKLFDRGAEELIGFYIGSFASTNPEIPMNIIRKNGQVLETIITPFELNVGQENLTLATIISENPYPVFA